MNLVDLLAVTLVAFAGLAGFRSGALPQLGGMAGAVAGAVVAIAAMPFLVDALADVDPPVRAATTVVSLLGVIGIGQAVGSGIGTAMGRALGTGVLSAADRIAGTVVGAGQALLVVWLAGGLLAVAALPRLSEQANNSGAVRVLNAILPPPTELVAELGTVLDASGLPDVFVGLEPMAAPPVARPSDPEAEAIAAAAIRSVARVSAGACGLTHTGTAFAIADGYFVTNAHVVAGAGPVRLATAGTHDAVVILFDPDLDVAVLYAPTLRQPALRFATTKPERGTVGAALGYPGGGMLSVIPAAVTDAYTAVGRDIAGERRVSRSVLELRAAVERGDSGGPFLLRDGSVGGVVFAESRSSEEVGYALDPAAVAIRVRPAIGRTSPVETGACLVD